MSGYVTTEEEAKMACNKRGWCWCLNERKKQLYTGDDILEGRSFVSIVNKALRQSIRRERPKMKRINWLAWGLVGLTLLVIFAFFGMVFWWG